MPKILIDMQACQTESRRRGIGRYAMALARAMASQSAGDEIHLLLNSAFPETILPLRQLFAPVIGEARIHILDVLSPNEDRVAANRWRKNASALLREAYIEMLAPDVVFCPSFFEGYIDNAVLSVNCFSTVPVVATLHDLIPLIYNKDYLDTAPDFERHYRGKIGEFKRCAGVLSVSESSASEGRQYLGFRPDHIANGSEAAGDIFRVLGLDDKTRQALKRKFGIEKPFVFYTGGSDPRKNLGRLVEAFARLPSAVRKNHQLVFAGQRSDSERLALEKAARLHGLAAGELKLLDYISDEDLVALYNLAEVFAFPSLHEGFGLPCLEAFQCGLPVLGSNISSLPEVIGNPDALFDPWSVDDIARKLTAVLSDSAFRASLAAKGAEQAAKFSWQRSASLALAALRKWARPAAQAGTWRDRLARHDAIQERLVAAISKLSDEWGAPQERDLLRAAKIIAAQRTMAEAHARPADFASPLRWRIEGPFDSTYSLALVNRELSRSLAAEGHVVSLWSSEETGDPAPADSFLASNPDLRAFYERAQHERAKDEGLKAHPVAEADIVSRNTYPPRVTNMNARVNALHNYAWEESGFPFAYVQDFNETLQFITVTAQHVKKVMIDNGVSVPIAVVGNGVDHWQNVVADKGYPIPPARHTFLHVSSCFPRKGADVLIESYGRSFTKDDDVLLIIKTFPNPHNTIEAEIEALRKRNPNYPEVHVILDDITDAQLKGLYERCDTLVAPSRAEGFGLPLAEAMLSGMHVITTGWSGQMDFCSADNVDLIDFTFAEAATHIKDKPTSVWAEPSVEHLALLMRRAFDKSSSAPSQRTVSRDVLSRYSWAQVARRNAEAAIRFSKQTIFPEPRIGWISTYNKRCGIATYSKHLIDVLGMPVTVLAGHADERTSADDETVLRCWHEGQRDDLDDVLARIDALDLDVIVIQFNYGFFEVDCLAAFIHKLVDRGKRVVITMHATVNPKVNHKTLAAALVRCDRILVHSIQDMNRLKAYGLVDNVCLFPHGVIAPEVDGQAPKPIGKGKPITIASFGFFLPHKGLLELIEAVYLLRQRQQDYRLILVNAEYPVRVSRQLIEKATALIKARGLSRHVELETSFLSDEDSLRKLASADLMVYAYQETAESASGAVRYGLASGKPVITTPLSIFEDVAGLVFHTPGTASADIAAGIEDTVAALAKRRPNALQLLERAFEWRQIHAYPQLGQRLGGMLRGIFRDGLLDGDAKLEPVPTSLGNT